MSLDSAPYRGRPPCPRKSPGTLHWKHHATQAAQRWYSPSCSGVTQPAAQVSSEFLPADKQDPTVQKDQKLLIRLPAEVSQLLLVITKTAADDDLGRPLGSCKCVSNHIKTLPSRFQSELLLARRNSQQAAAQACALALSPSACFKATSPTGSDGISLWCGLHFLMTVDAEYPSMGTLSSIQNG